MLGPGKAMAPKSFAVVGRDAAWGNSDHRKEKLLTRAARVTNGLAGTMSVVGSSADQPMDWSKSRP